MKIAFISSSGGHWEELMCLNQIAELYECFYITENGGQIEPDSKPNLYLLNKIDRHERGFLKHFCLLFFDAVRIIKKEKPDVIITTGALISYPFCLISKLFGKKVIYIESFARVNNKSLTGRLVYPIADVFIVQWKSMLKCYPKAIYGGSIF